MADLNDLQLGYERVERNGLVIHEVVFRCGEHEYRTETPEIHGRVDPEQFVLDLALIGLPGIKEMCARG